MRIGEDEILAWISVAEMRVAYRENFKGLYLHDSPHAAEERHSMTHRGVERQLLGALR